MNRASKTFRPCLDQLDKKTLLSAGQISHLAGALHGAVPRAEDYKAYAVLINKTGKDLTISWVWTQGAYTSDTGRWTFGRTGEKRIESPALKGASITLEVTIAGGKRTFYPTGYKYPGAHGEDRIELR